MCMCVCVCVCVYIRDEKKDSEHQQCNPVVTHVRKYVSVYPTPPKYLSCDLQVTLI